MACCDLPSRHSDAGPEDASGDWQDSVHAAIEHLQAALYGDDVRQTDLCFRAAGESLERAREKWGAVADREHAEFLRRW
jgi:hypothetical protein